MYNVIAQIKETIAQKKKAIEEKQQKANQLIFDANENLQEMHRTKHHVEVLENELYSLEKQKSCDGVAKSAVNNPDCSPRVDKACTTSGPFSNTLSNEPDGLSINELNAGTVNLNFISER